MILTSLIEDIGNKVVKIRVLDSQIIDYDELYVDVVTTLRNGVCLSYLSKSQHKMFLRSLIKLQILYTEYGQFITINFVINSIEDIINLPNQYFITHYYNANISDSGKKSNEIILKSLFGYWEFSVKNVQGFEYKLLYRYMYDNSFMSDIGEINLNFDNRVNFPIYLNRILGKTIETTCLTKIWIETPLFSKYNDKKYLMCDHKSGKGTYNPKVIFVGISFPHDFAYYYYKVQIIQGLLTAISGYNTIYKVEQDYVIVPYILPPEEEKDMYIEGLEKFSTEYEGTVVFGGLKIYTEAFEKFNNLLFFYSGMTASEKCYRNAYYFTLPYRNTLPVVKHMMAISESILILYDTTTSTSIYVKDQINEYLLSLGIRSELLSVPKDTNNYDHISRKIKIKYTKAVILNLLDFGLKTFLTSFNTLGLHPPDIMMVSFFYDFDTIKNSQSVSIDDFYYWLQYDTGITKYPIELMIKRHVPVEYVPFLFINTFSSYQFWINTIRHTKSMDNEIIKKSIYDVKTNLLMGNKLFMKPSNEINLQLYLIQVNQTDVKVILNQSDSTLMSISINDNFYCDYKSSNGIETIEKVINIRIMISIFNYPSREYFNLVTVLGTIEYLNNINSPKIYLKIRVLKATTKQEEVDIVTEYLATDELVLIGCFSSQCIDNIREIINDSNKLMISPTVHQGEFCSHNILMTGLTPNLFIPISMNYAISHSFNTKLQFLGMDDLFSKTVESLISIRFRKIFEIQPSIFFEEEKQSFSISEIQNIFQLLMINNKPSGVMILTLSIQLTKNFILYFNKNNFDKNLLFIMSYNSDESDIVKVFDGINPNGLSFVTSIVYSSAISQPLKNIKYFTGSDQMTNLQTNSYEAIIIWFTQMKKIDFSLKIEAIQKSLYNTEVEFNSEKYKIGPNLHTHKFTSLLRYNDFSTEFLLIGTNYHKTNFFSYFLESDNTRVCDLGMEIFDVPIDGKVTIEKVIFLLSFNQAYSFNYIELVEVMLESTYFDTEKLIIDVLFENISDELEVCKDQVKKYTNIAKIMFGTLTVECRESVFPLFKKNQIIYVSLSYGSNNFCDQYYFATIADPSVFYKSIVHISYMYNNIAIISTSLFANYFEEALNLLGANIPYIRVIDPFILLNKEILKNEIINATEENKVDVILFDGPTAWHLLLNEILLEVEFQEPIKWFTFSQPILDYDRANYHDFTAIGTYFLSIDLPENKEYIAEVVDKFTNKNMIESSITHLFEMTNIFLLTLKLIKDNDFSEISNFIRKVKFNGPVGEVSLANNNMLKHRVFFAKLDYTVRGHLKIISEQSSFIIPNIYTNQFDHTYYYCDLEKPQKDASKIAKAITKLGFALSITGDNGEIEKGLLIEGLAAIYELNLNGGMQGTYVVPLVYDCQSSVKLCIAMIGDLLDDEDILALFIGSKAELAMEINEKYRDPPKLIYSFSRISINQCSNALISYYLSESQIARASYHVSFLLSSNFIIVHNDNVESTGAARFLQSLYVQVRAELYGMKIYKKVQTVSEIMINLPAGSLIINMIQGRESVEFVNELCSRLEEINYLVLLTFMSTSERNKINKKCLNNIYELTTFHPLLAQIENNQLASQVGVNQIAAKAIINYLDFFKEKDIGSIEALFMSMYDAIMSFGEVCKSSISLGKKDLLLRLINKPFSTSSGFVVIDNIFYSIRAIYLIKYENQKPVLTSSVQFHIYSEVFLPYEESTSGQDCVPGSNFTLKIIQKKVLKLSFYHEQSENNKDEIFKAIFEADYVKRLNKNVFITGYIFLPLIVFRPANTNELLVLSKRNSEDPSIVASFGCSDTRTKDQVAFSYSSINRLFFFTSVSDGGNCNKWIINTGLEIMQKVKTTVDYLVDFGISIFIAVGNMDNDSILMIEKVKQYVRKKGKQILNPCQEQIPVAIDKLFECINNSTFDFAYANKIAVISLLEGKEFVTFANNINKINNLYNLQLVFLYFNKFLLSNEILLQLTDSLYIVSYDPVVDNTNNFIFVKMVNREIIQGFPLFEDIETSYVALEMWKKTFETLYRKKKAIPTEDEMRIQLIGSSFDAPSGKVKVASSNYVSRNIYIIKQVSIIEVTQIYPMFGMANIVDPEPSESPDECFYSKTDIQYSYSALMIEIIDRFTITLLAIELLIFLILIFNRNNAAFHCSGSFFSIFYCFYFVLLCGLVKLYLINDNSVPELCKLQIFGTAIVLTMYQCTLIVKSWRIDELFNNKNLKRVVISNTYLIKILLCILFFEAIYCCVWVFSTTNSMFTTINHSLSTQFNDVYTTGCRINSYFSLVQVLMSVILSFYGLFLAWSIRNTPKEFNESTNLSCSMLSYIVLINPLFLLNIYFKDYPSLLVATRTIILLSFVIFNTVVQFASSIIKLSRTIFSFNSSSYSHSKISDSLLHSSNQSIQENIIFFDKRQKIIKNLKYKLNISNAVDPICIASALKLNCIKETKKVKLSRVI